MKEHCGRDDANDGAGSEFTRYYDGDDDARREGSLYIIEYICGTRTRWTLHDQTPSAKKQISIFRLQPPKQSPRCSIKGDTHHIKSRREYNSTSIQVRQARGRVYIVMTVATSTAVDTGFVDLKYWCLALVSDHVCIRRMYSGIRDVHEQY